MTPGNACKMLHLSVVWSSCNKIFTTGVNLCAFNWWNAQYAGNKQEPTYIYIFLGGGGIKQKKNVRGLPLGGVRREASGDSKGAPVCSGAGTMRNLRSVVVNGMM